MPGMSETTETSETNQTKAIAVGNQKGGAGKTTTVVHLAGALNDRGHDVLVVDLDKQGGLTNAFGHSETYYDLSRETTMYEVLWDLDRTEQVNDLVLENEEFDLIPATERYMNQSNINQLAEAGRSHRRLELALDALEHDYDWVVIDTTPDLNVLTDNAIVGAGNLLVPFFPEELNKNSLRLLLKQLKNLEKLHGDINDIALIASRVEHNNGEHERVVDDVDDGFEHPLITIPKRTDLSNAIGAGTSIFGFEKENKRVRDAQATFEELAELVEREAVA